MSKIIKTKGRRVENVAVEAQEVLEEGKEVVLQIQGNADPERIFEILYVTVGDYEIDLTVRCPELKEYLTHALAGVAIGGGVGAAAALTAAAAGAPVTLPVTLGLIGIGALIGGAIGSGTAFVSSATVYKYRGETRIKLQPA